MLPSQKEISHVSVRLLLQGTLKQFNATFLTHAKSQNNELKISLRTMKTTRWHEERKENPRSTRTPCLTSKLSKETGQLNKTHQSSRFAFLLLHSLTTTLSVFVIGRSR